MPAFTDLSGQRFGRWLILERSGTKNYPSGARQPQYLCKCDCGNEKIVVSSILRDGSSKSCGCLNAEVRRAICIKRNTTHGLAHTRTYDIWGGMIARCHIESSSGYYKYGARGIHVSDDWRSFENFFRDMGECLEGFSIERSNPFLGYQKGNCEWIPLSDQQKNKTNSAIRCEADLLRLIRLYCEATGETPAQLISKLRESSR